MVKCRHRTQCEKGVQPLIIVAIFFYVHVCTYILLFLSDNGNANLEADLERAEKEIEQLKTDREVAIEKKDKQVKEGEELVALVLFRECLSVILLSFHFISFPVADTSVENSHGKIQKGEVSDMMSYSFE